MSENFRQGSVVAGYRLESLVGRGGMAEVWLARRAGLTRPVALKIPALALAADPAFRQRFIAEAQLAAMVEHPNVVTVYDAGEVDGVPFIAMRFIDGEDLGKVLRREGRLTPERAMEFISPVASALDAAHAEGVVHRDVKPANILVRARPGSPEQVYLTDFGIAKAERSTSLTQSGHWVGTLAYAAPEQINGGTVDGRTDQYALACLAYQLLTGEMPFPGDQVLAVQYGHMFASPPLLTKSRPDLPAAADMVLAKAMDKTPGKRYDSCGTFADQLRRALGVFPYGPRDYAPAPASRQRTVTGSRPGDASPARQAMPPRSDTEPLTVSSKADKLFRELRAPARRAAAKRRTWELGGRDARQVLKVAALVAVSVAAVAVIAIALLETHPWTSTSAASVSGESPFAGYTGQHGTVTVNSLAEGDGTLLAAGTADGHPAIWRQQGASGTWKLLSASVSGLSGELKGIAYGNKGWLAVGEAMHSGGMQPVTAISSNGVHWKVGFPSFGAQDPIVTGDAAGQGGYVVVGTQVSNLNPANRVATMWSSTDLQNWQSGNNDYGTLPNGQPKLLNGGMHGSFAEAVVTDPTGTFVAVGSSYGNNSAACTYWIAVTNAGQQWSLVRVPLPRGASSAALSLVAVNGSDVALAAGDAVSRRGGDEPIVFVAKGNGQGSLVVLPGGQGTVTALTGTVSGFIVAGEIGPVGARHAVTWDLPDGRNPSSAWKNISPDPVPSGVQQITALYTAGNLLTEAGQQGRAEIAILMKLP